MPEHTRFTWEKEAIKAELNGEAARVLWAYASFSDSDTLLTFPTIRQVADATGISVEKVGNYRKALLATGWLAEHPTEKTTRGNPKLMLAVGESIEEKSYLGVKKAMNPKSMGNLVPGAKQKKKAQVLDTPDEAGLEHRENTGLEHRDIQALDTPDVTTSELNNHSRTTSYNHAPADADAVAIRKDEGMSYTYLGSLNVEDFADLSLTMETASFDYLANSEGVYRSPNPKKEAVLPNVDSRHAAYRCGYTGDNRQHHIANHMRLGQKDAVQMAKYCPTKTAV